MDPAQLGGLRQKRKGPPKHTRLHSCVMVQRGCCAIFSPICILLLPMHSRLSSLLPDLLNGVRPRAKGRATRLVQSLICRGASATGLPLATSLLSYIALVALCSQLAPTHCHSSMHCHMVARRETIESLLCQLMWHLSTHNTQHSSDQQPPHHPQFTKPPSLHISATLCDCCTSRLAWC